MKILRKERKGCGSRRELPNYSPSKQVSVRCLLAAALLLILVLGLVANKTTTVAHAIHGTVHTDGSATTAAGITPEAPRLASRAGSRPPREKVTRRPGAHSQGIAEKIVHATGVEPRTSGDALHNKFRSVGIGPSRAKDARSPGTHTPAEFHKDSRVASSTKAIINYTRSLLRPTQTGRNTGVQSQGYTPEQQEKGKALLIGMGCSATNWVLPIQEAQPTTSKNPTQTLPASETFFDCTLHRSKGTSGAQLTPMSAKPHHGVRLYLGLPPGT
jgi:hypothetical protein